MKTQTFLAVMKDGFTALVRKINGYYFRVNSKGERKQIKREDFILVG